MDKGVRCRTLNKSDSRGKRKKPWVSHYATPVHKTVRWKTEGGKRSQHIECTPVRVVTIHAGRSLSLQDLSPGLEDNLALRRTLICHTDVPRAECLPQVSTHDAQAKLLAFIAYGRFLKKAWRKRKEISERLAIKLDISNAQGKSLKTQVESLKSLLTSDEQIISSSFREVQSLKVALVTVETKYNLVHEEKEELEKRSQKLREDLLKTEAEASNNKNSFIFAKNEINNLEEQLHKEKERSGKVKKENKILQSKLENLTNGFKGKCVALERSEQMILVLKEQLKTHLQLLKEYRGKVEDSDRALESAQKQMEIFHIRIKEERMAHNALIQEQLMKSNQLEAQLSFYTSPSLKTKIIRFTEWLINIPVMLASW